MMYTRWRKVWEDFWGNKTRTFLMVLTILVGVFSVGLVNNMAIMMNHDMDADFLSANPSEAKIYAYPLNQAWVRSLRDVEGVGDLEGRYALNGTWNTAEGQAITVQFSSIKSIFEQDVDVLKPADPEAGLYPELGLHDVVFDRSAATLGLEPGDVIEIELPGGEKRQMRFTGYVHDATTFPYAMGMTVSAYITPETAEWMGAEPGVYNQLLVSVAENPTDRNHVSQVVTRITDRFEKDNVSLNGIFMYNPGHHFAWEITQGVVFIMSLFGWMSVVLSGFLIVNTIVALMSQHTRQIGILKAIGADEGQIFPMYLALILSFGVMAFVISAPLSFWAARQFLVFMAVFLNFDLTSTSLYPGVVWMQAGVALLTPLVAAIVPLFNGLRVSVREALGSYGLGGGSQSPSKTTESRLGFIPRQVLVSLRNAFRRKARVSLTIFTLVLAGAIFIAVFNLWASFDRVMVEIQGYFLADINVSFTGNYPFSSVNKIASAVPGVESTEGWLVYNGKILSTDGEQEDGIAFVAPPSDSTLIQPSLVEGRWIMPGDKNVIVIGNHLLAIRPDLKVGDWVTIKIDDKKVRWQIIGVYRMPGNVVPPLVYTSYEYLSYQVGMTGQIFELRVITYDKDSWSQDQVSTELQKQFKQRGIGISYVQTAGQWYQSQKSQTDVLVYNMLVMAILIAVVGGLGLTSTMSLNVMERTREIGVMRAIGAADGDIQRIVVTEGLVIGFVSWAFGVILSLPITYVLIYGVGMAVFKAPLTVVFGWAGTFAWLACMLAIAAIASAVPAWRASRLTVRDTLVYE
ncbi:MAG: FtsX-like permease family protein [Anaerolineae bacterium]|nr:FtsX-like permease family protein [Anaerolineae bacterium]